MAILQVGSGVVPAEAAALARAADRVPEGAPVAILVHGFKFRSGDPRCDPHVRLYGAPAPAGALRCADWPRALGFASDGVADGLCLGFGWDARADHLPNLARRGSNGFAVAYARAREAGERLGALIAALRARRPDLEVDLLAHSLGARVALIAAAAGASRLVLLGAAEDAEEAAFRLDAAPAVAVHHVAARHNDPFDLMFEAAAPRRARRGAVALGRAGLAGAPRARWMDLELDSDALRGWLAGRGVDLAPRSPAVCHWSFYLRPGAMAFYRAILRDRAAWSVEAMRAAGAPEGLTRRWRRFAPFVPALAARLGAGWDAVPGEEAAPAS